MRPTMVEAQGALQADGTLVLNEKPNLPPGPVRVTVHAVSSPAETDMDVIAVRHRIHADQAAREHVPRSREEIDAEIAAMRDEDEERMQGIERIHEECERFRQQKVKETT